MGSGDVIHRDDVMGDMKGRLLENVAYDRWHMKHLWLLTQEMLMTTDTLV
jgi:hypothetical protein